MPLSLMLLFWLQANVSLPVLLQAATALVTIAAVIVGGQITMTYISKRQDEMLDSMKRFSETAARLEKDDAVNTEQHRALAERHGTLAERIGKVETAVSSHEEEIQRLRTGQHIINNELMRNSPEWKPYRPL